MRSRLLVGLLSIAMSGSIALAGDAPPPDAAPPSASAEAGPTAAPKKPNVRVVKVMADTQEALLLDRTTNKHLVVDVGSEVGAYQVVSISDDEVTLEAGRSELVLSAPEHWTRRGRTTKTTAANSDEAFIDGSVDPYADPSTTVRSVSQPTPIVAGQYGVRIARADGAMADVDDALDAGPAPAMISPPAAGALATAPPTIGSSDPYGDAPGPVTAAGPIAPAATPAPVAAPVVTPTVLMHSELNTALADFTKLTSSVTGEFTAQGVHLDRVADGSVFAHVGLKAGDTVVAVDNKPLRTIDDAADLYSRAGSTKAANIQVLRAGKPMTLRVLFN
ncbi:hypothetical protein BH11MYX2_BH11MYX2_15790 [soil metagenome]